MCIGVHTCGERERKRFTLCSYSPNSLHLEAVCFSVGYSEHPGCGPPRAIPELLHSPNLPPRPWGCLRLPEKLRLREGTWFVAVFPDGSDSKESSSVQETRVQSLGQEDPLEKGMATQSSILAWRNPLDRGAWRATVHGVAKSWTRLSD